MEPGLAARHPEIKTYAGRGIDDPAATIRADQTPLGFHASVRSPGGAWYVDPYYHLDDSVYITYYGRDVSDDPHGAVRRAGARRGHRPARARRPSRRARGAAADLPARAPHRPDYSTYFGGPQNVTAAKVTLMNRVNQVYEDETAIRLVLIADNDRLNLDTAGADHRAERAVRRRGVLTPVARVRRRHAHPHPHRDRPAHRREQLRHRPHRARRRRRRRRQPRRRRRQRQGAGLHRPADPGRRLLRGRLRGARDGPPVRRPPHVQRHAAQLLRRQPQRRPARSSPAAARRSWPTPASASRTTCSRTATRTGRSAASTRSRRT